MASIQLENVTVEYPIYGAGGMSLRNQLVNISTGGRLSKTSRSTMNVTALKDINLLLAEGDRVGVMGHNGSGKTTLLRTMARIFRPVRGKVTVIGRVSTVFGLGAGMVGDLNGYENIIRMSMLLGATIEEAEASIPDVEDFTELGNFLSVPVRTYSAGMTTRLLFAVATAVHPEILIVDEVFGAGDAEFQQKAEKRMVGFIEKASVFVLASHSDGLLQKFCNRFISLSHGTLVES